ncbi:MAG: AMP-dependent synthetase, partial [Gammaproteobacteria bacterium]|nr:AMP-dependent synthetase [Gammaproteobacteria bacterium]
MAAELRTLVDFVAARNPESIAVLAPKRSALSYRGLQACLSDIESALVGAGLGPASRVATVLPN